MERILILILIGVGMWVLQYIFRDAEEEQATQQRRRNPQRPGGQPPRSRPASSERARRAPSDLDRFLEQARRRRQGQEPVAEAEVVRESPPVRERPPEVRPVRQAPPPPPPQPRPAPRHEPTVTTPAPRSVPSAQPVLEIPIEVVEGPVAVVGPRKEKNEKEEINLTSPSERESSAKTPALERVAQLISQKEGFEAAVILHEILSPPLYRRGGSYKLPVDR